MADSGVRPGEEVAAKPPKSKAIAILRSIPRYVWIVLSFVVKFIASKVLECLGLLMTVQQHQFWNAVQLKRVIADFKSMIKYCDDRAIEIPTVPIALDSALRQADHAIHAEFVEICELNYISIKQLTKPIPPTTANARPTRYPSFLMRNVGIPSIRGQRQVGVDAGTDDVDGCEETDGAGTPLFKEEHASKVKVKPIGKVHTGRLSTKIEEEDEGYGGFCNALVYLLKGVWKSITESITESFEVATVSIEDVQPEFHVGKKSFGLDSDSVVPKSVVQVDGRTSISSSDHVDRPVLSKDDHDDMMFFGVPRRAPRRVHRKKHVTPIVKGVTQIDGDETDGPDFMKIGRRGLFKVKNSKIWQCFHQKAKDGYRPAKNLFQTINEFIPLRVSNFRYKEFGSSDYHKVKELQDRASRWPVFSYWLMFAHVLILIVTLSVYGIAPIGYGQFTERALVQLSDLSVQVVEKNVTPNVFIGSTQEALVLLGANYAPCMRRDKLLFEALEIDMNREASESGCCVRNDRSGCVQVPSRQRCPEAVKIARFVFNDTDIANRSMGQEYSNRAVCGTSPTTCVNPSPNQDPRWRLPNITQWPICLQSEASGNDPDHLTCNLTGRPCCVGIQALCLITTLEHCTFLGGRFHQTAFLCSQVDCLDDICGLIPFSTSGMPDQVYRLWISLFLHGGILHILVILVMTFYILRDLEKYLGWLATVILFLGTGIGGNIASVLFVPYNPQVGPSAGIFGAIAFFLVYIIYHWNYFKFPIFEILKYLFLVIAPLFFIGLFPYIDNYARVFGFIFGIFFSFIFVHYIPPNDVLTEFRKYEFRAKNGPHKRYRGINWSQYVKVAMILTGLGAIVGLYLFCFIWFYGVQTTWTGFTYFNCIPFTDTLCLDYRQQVRSRDTFQ